MPSIDLRKALNAISDVVVNRPTPLRKFDQIHMRVSDMLLQAEHLSKWLAGKHAIFIGDGDAIGLSLVHLSKSGILPHGPNSVHVVDFDERVVNSVKRFSEQYDLSGTVTAELYNVADPLPEHLWQAYDAFYTNPPFGASNDGMSVKAFVKRGMEATSTGAVACLAVADHPEFGWSHSVLRNIQRYLLSNEFVIAEMIPEFHQYHLDDAPALTSCSLVAQRQLYQPESYHSESLAPGMLINFYGRDKVLEIRYVRDGHVSGHCASNRYTFEYMSAAQGGIV